MAKQSISLDEVKAMDRETLTPTIVGRVIGCDSYNITLMARQAPHMLGFPCIVVKSRTLIPRRAFIAWMEGEKPSGQAAT